MAGLTRDYGEASSLRPERERMTADPHDRGRDREDRDVADEIKPGGVQEISEG